MAHASTRERDLTGLCLFDETGVRRLIRPGRGPRHLWHLLDELTDAAGLLPEDAVKLVNQAKTSEVMAPTGSVGVVEFIHASDDQYFLTSNATEATPQRSNLFTAPSPSIRENP